MLDRWKQLAVFLIVRHNDMTVKPVLNGRFVRTKDGLGAPVERPGYPKKFAREMLRLSNKNCLPAAD